MTPSSFLAVTQSIVPASGTTASSLGTAVDWSGYNGVAGVVDIGNVAAATTMTLVLEESDSTTPWVTIQTLSKTVADANKAFLLSGPRQASSKKNVRLRVQRASGAAMAGGVIITLGPKQADG